MNLKIATDKNDMARQAHAWLEERATEQGIKSFFLAAGATPQPLYRLWREKLPAFMKTLTFTQIDEIATGSKRGAFEDFFKAELPDLLPQFCWVKDCPPGAHAAVLGFGTNGHVGFHEPGLAANFNFGCVRLSTETVKKLDLESRSWGLTFGVGALLQCQSLLLLISGNGKDAALKSFLENSDTPASQLKSHSDLTVIVDSQTVRLPKNAI